MRFIARDGVPPNRAPGSRGSRGSHTNRTRQASGVHAAADVVPRGVRFSRVKRRTYRTDRRWGVFVYRPVISGGGQELITPKGPGRVKISSACVRAYKGMRGRTCVFVCAFARGGLVCMFAFVAEGGEAPSSRCAKEKIVCVQKCAQGAPPAAARRRGASALSRLR